MARKKIAHVITRLIVGGAQENTLFTVEGLALNPDYEVTLIMGPESGPEGSLLEGEWRKSVRVEVLNHMCRNINPIRDMLTYWQLYRHFKKEKYDLVHTHSSKAGILARMAAKKAGIRLIVHTIHGLPFFPYQSWVANRFYIVLEKMAARATDKIISVADEMTNKAVAAGIAGHDKFMTIYSGMDLDSFIESPKLREATRAELGIRPDELVVGKIARLFKMKGHEYLFEAAPRIIKAVPKVRFLLVGDGILRDQFEKQLDNMGIQQCFIFAGLVPPTKIPAMISAMDVVVHVSLREGLPRVLPQALAAGKPAVSFNLDGAPEVIINGKTGYLVSPGDKEGLVETIVNLLKDEPKRTAMGQAGCKQVYPLFRKEYMVQKIDKLYQVLGL